MNSSVFAIGLALVLTGFVMVIVGSFGTGQVSTGGFILIGPLPIAFGTGKAGGVLALASILMGLIILIFLLLVVNSSKGRTGRGNA